VPESEPSNLDGPASISVLLPVHAGVDPDHFRRALDSILEQTLQPAEIVLVEDGPLPAGLRTVVDGYAGTPELVRVVLPVNRGAGVANGAGLRRARCTWIAKADADDVNLPTRFERQLAAAVAGDLDLVGAALDEFVGGEADVVARRAAPESAEAIARRMPINNPVNHPTAFFRRSLALDVGGYPDLRYMQDYDLFARMLVAGARMRNLPEALVLFRAGDAMYARRTSRAMTRCEWQLQANLRRYGVVGPLRRWTNLAMRLTFRRLPRPLLRLAYRLLLSSAPAAQPVTGRPAVSARP
jgi:glycosyltransferase involved in cell wall biosynthesis